jgi:hypothetical protein
MRPIPGRLQVVLAITKKQGLDAGGLWWSKNSGKDWVEKTSLLTGAAPFDHGSQQRHPASNLMQLHSACQRHVLNSLS